MFKRNVAILRKQPKCPENISLHLLNEAFICCWLTEKAFKNTKHWMIPSMVSPVKQKVPVMCRPLRPTAEASDAWTRARRWPCDSGKLGGNGAARINRSSESMLKRWGVSISRRLLVLLLQIRTAEWWIHHVADDVWIDNDFEKPLLYKDAYRMPRWRLQTHQKCNPNFTGFFSIFDFFSLIVWFMFRWSYWRVGLRVGKYF